MAGEHVRCSAQELTTVSFAKQTGGEAVQVSLCGVLSNARSSHSTVRYCVHSTKTEQLLPYYALDEPLPPCPSTWIGSPCDCYQVPSEVHH